MTHDIGDKNGRPVLCVAWRLKQGEIYIVKRGAQVGNDVRRQVPVENKLTYVGFVDACSICRAHEINSLLLKRSRSQMSNTEIIARISIKEDPWEIVCLEKG